MCHQKSSYSSHLTVICTVKCIYSAVLHSLQFPPARLNIFFNYTQPTGGYSIPPPCIGPFKKRSKVEGLACVNVLLEMSLSCTIYRFSQA